MSDLTPGRPDLAVATLLAGAVPSRCRVSVDLSRAESTARRVVGFEDCDRPLPGIGDLVTACDLTGWREATAEVVGIDEGERTISLAIDWRTIREVTA